MTSLLNELLAVSIYQKLALLFSLAYIILAVRNVPLCFVFGLLGAIFWTLESYLVLQLKFDAILQVFYVLMSLWGLWQWIADEQQAPRNQTIKSMRLRQHIFALVMGVILTLILALIVAPLISTKLPFLDAGTTVFSMIATYLLVQRYVENWIYFTVVNSLYVYIYLRFDAHLFVIMMLIYLVMAVVGFFNWRKLSRNTTI